MGTFLVIKALACISLLLTVSFFVLFAVRKIDGQAQGLKAFGYAITVLLWITAAVILVVKIYAISTGKCHMTSKMGHHTQEYQKEQYMMKHDK